MARPRRSTSAAAPDGAYSMWKPCSSTGTGMHCGAGNCELADAQPPGGVAGHRVVLVDVPERAVVHGVHVHRRVVAPAVAGARLGADAVDDDAFALRHLPEGIARRRPGVTDARERRRSRRKRCSRAPCSRPGPWRCCPSSGGCRRWRRASRCPAGRRPASRSGSGSRTSGCRTCRRAPPRTGSSRSTRASRSSGRPAAQWAAAGSPGGRSLRGRRAGGCNRGCRARCRA